MSLVRDVLLVAGAADLDEVARALARCGVHALTVRDGEAAVRALRRGTGRVAIVDVTIGRAHVEALLAQIARCQDLRHAAVVVLAPIGLPLGRIRARAAHVADWPARPEALTPVVLDLLARAVEPAAARRRPPA